MRFFVIVNPAAGAGRARSVWSRMERALGSSRVELVCSITRGPGHARQLAREVALQRIERVVVVGGDGTVSEVGGALAGTRTGLAIVPAGTGNDVSAALGVPADPLAAADVAFGSQVTRPIDVGRMQHSQGSVEFLNVAGFGFDAEVVRRLPRPARWPVGSARLPYVVGVLRTLLSARPRRVCLTIDGERVERSALLVAVANGPRYAGGMLIAPDAGLDSGWLEVCLVGSVSRGEILWLLPTMYRGGHRGHPKVEFYRCREVRAACVDDHALVWCQLDGELVGRLPATFRVLPAALHCVIPAPNLNGKRCVHQPDGR